MINKIIVGVILVVFGVALALGVSEWIVRYFHMAPDLALVSKGRYLLSPDPKLGYMPRPGIAYDGESLLWYDYRTAETNSLGYRSDEVPVTKTPGALRVAVLGDSLAVGLWIDKYADTFPGVIRDTLKASTTQKVELLNFGVVGYNTMQEVETLATIGWKFTPDVVVVEYCHNDRERSDGTLLGSLLAEAVSSQKSPAELPSRLLQASALSRLVYFRLNPPEVKPVGDEMVKRYDPLSRDTVQESFAALGQLVKNTQTKVLVAIFPKFGDLQNYAYGGETEAVTGYTKEAGLNSLDLLPTFQECEKKLGHGLSSDEFHPNADGYRCAGQAIAKEIVRMTNLGNNSR